MVPIHEVLQEISRVAVSGEIVVFGSTALQFTGVVVDESERIDLLVEPAECGQRIEASMGAQSAYNEKHGLSVRVQPAEAFLAPQSWRARSKKIEGLYAPEVNFIIPHPHDIVMSALEHFESQDREIARLVLEAMPLSGDDLEALAADMPHRKQAISDPKRCEAFEKHLEALSKMLP
ncbi:MAG: hypothetical protein JXR96_30415 [Deltaproteobacteria bacterium]|nr:hypothetical protein [Deltaproteobacteria bacterium]